MDKAKRSRAGGAKGRSAKSKKKLGDSALKDLEIMDGRTGGVKGGALRKRMGRRDFGKKARW